MSTAPARMSSEAFAYVGEDARAFIYEKVAMLCEAATGPEVVQAVLLGSLGAVLEAWVAQIDQGVTRDDFARAMRAAVQDLATQAYEGRHD